MQAAVVPLLLAFIGVYAVYRGVNVFTVFTDGARKGLQTAVGILPTMVGMLTAVYMLRASGAIDLMSGLLSPAFGLLGIPKECVPLALLKPISGGGGLALGSELIRSAGADSTSAVSRRSCSAHPKRASIPSVCTPDISVCEKPVTQFRQHYAQIWQRLRPLRH